MELDGLKPRVNNGNGILSTAQLENRPYEISRDKVINKCSQLNMAAFRRGNKKDVAEQKIQ